MQAVLDRFALTAPLARGGMGELWLADDLDRHARVVIKTVRPDLRDDRDVTDWFRREIAVTSRLDHAHVVRHVASGSWQGADVLALEHITGTSIAQLTRTTRIGVAAAVGIARDIADALAYVHALTADDGAPLGIVHGDISPQNILIDRTGGAHLIDFGTVTLAEDAVVDVAGKPGYLSPEQSRGDRPTAKSDQYSLGVVLWELLARRELFESDARRRGVVIPPIRRAAVSPELEAIVRRMLAYEESARFSSMLDVTEALESLNHGTC
jgi:serine/threonine-protein kinase